MATPAGQGVADLLLAIAKSKPVVGSAATAAALSSDDAEAGFIGKSSKIWDEVAEALATTMRHHGVSRDDVWRKVGVDLDNVDGLPRMEIDDSTMRARPRSEWSWGNQEDFIYGDGAIGSVGDFIEHPELERAYDGIVDFGDANQRTTMRIKNLLGGEYNPETDSIRIAADRIDGEWVPDRSVAGHELMHVIQEKEGFAKGGSPRVEQKILQKRKDSAEEAISNINNQLSDTANQLEATRAVGGNTKALEADYQDWMAARSERVADAQLDPVLDGHSNYKKLAGETEARNVQKRMDMDWKQRRETPPWHTADVPESEQIVRMRGSADPRLLAGLASGTGAAAYANIDERGRPTDPVHGDIRAPDHPTVLKLADALSKISSSVEGSPAEIFSPEATADWLRKLAYKQTPNWQDRIGVLGDFL